jgi:hypothetical protein
MSVMIAALGAQRTLSESRQMPALLRGVHPVHVVRDDYLGRSEKTQILPSRHPISRCKL